MALLFRILPLLLLFVALLPAPTHAERAPVEIIIPEGSFLVREPESWDGKRPLPLLMFFHGYGQRGMTVIKNKILTAALKDREILLIAPNGEEKRWAHQGAPRRERLLDDDAFVRAIIVEVQRRWPVDTRRIWASGFSIGGSMAWHVACYIGKPFTAFMPVAGAFWRPQPSACQAGPASIFHTHGMQDTVVPMEGRPIRFRYHQGDVRRSTQLWRETNSCKASDLRVESIGNLTCEISDACGSGAEVRLCLHPGGHSIPKGWAGPALDWAEKISKN